MIEAGSPSEFSREEGAPSTKEEWDALSSEEKLLWEQRRRRRKFIRRHGHRAKGIAQVVNPQDRSTQLGLRGRGHLRAKRKVDVRLPTPEQLADKPGLEPTRSIPDSGHRGPSGNTHQTDLRLVRRSQRERWKISEAMTQEVPDTLLKIINANDGDAGRPEIGIQAARALAQFMAQNQADEHEAIKRSSLTKEQVATLVRDVIETVQTEVDDPAVRQRIASKLGTTLMAMGVVASHNHPPQDTLAHPKYDTST